MDPSIQSLVEQIHASPKMAVLALGGAGSQALAWLLGAPGASRTVLEAVVPYGRRAMSEFLGYEPAQYVSPQMAKELAKVAYARALRLREAREPVVGVGCTATIATDRPKRGEHRCCVATWDYTGATTYDLKLAKGRRDRSGEEDVASRLVLNALAEICGLGPELPLTLIETERVEELHTAHPNPLERLLAPLPSSGPGGVRTVLVYPDGKMEVDQEVTGAVLPGAFDPLHQGHEGLATAASEMLGFRVVFELSVVNVDKPSLKEEEVRRRLRQFQDKAQVVLTRAPTFREKAALFPGCVFVIGWDTAVRVVHPSYHGGHEEGVREALAEVRAAGCRFLVAGRLQEGIFHTVADVDVPQEFADLFEPIPESRFRVDISSTGLRSPLGGD